jgi:hypothetical protein
MVPLSVFSISITSVGALFANRNERRDEVIGFKVYGQMDVVVEDDVRFNIGKSKVVT